MIRKISTNGRKILYLTFDDGPEAGSTEAVLALLKKHEISATFFLVAQKAERNPNLFHEIRNLGHAVGNHSWDHGYSHFFRGKSSLRKWIELAEASFVKLQGQPTIGFRPPNGIRTPELHAALRELNMPLILWNTRFYDAIFSWTKKKALKSLKTARSGDIILLHDRQSAEKLPVFLQTLEAYVVAAMDDGFEFDKISIRNENASN